MKKRTTDVPMICISLRVLFDKLREGAMWSEGIAEAQVAAYWLEESLLQRYGHEPDNARIVRNTFEAVKQDFDLAWDAAQGSAVAA